MIRFIDLGDQICDDCKEFAWYDTVVDRFIEIYGSYTWYEWEDFEYDCRKHTGIIDIERFRRLFPDNWGVKKSKRLPRLLLTKYPKFMTKKEMKALAKMDAENACESLGLNKKKVKKQ